MASRKRGREEPDDSGSGFEDHPPKKKQKKPGVGWLWRSSAGFASFFARPEPFVVSIPASSPSSPPPRSIFTFGEAPRHQPVRSAVGTTSTLGAAPQSRGLGDQLLRCRELREKEWGSIEERWAMSSNKYWALTLDPSTSNCLDLVFKDHDLQRCGTYSDRKLDCVFGLPACVNPVKETSAEEEPLSDASRISCIRTLLDGTLLKGKVVNGIYGDIDQYWRGHIDQSCTEASLVRKQIQAMITELDRVVEAEQEALRKAGASHKMVEMRATLARKLELEGRREQINREARRTGGEDCKRLVAQDLLMRVVKRLKPSSSIVEVLTNYRESGGPTSGEREKSRWCWSEEDGELLGKLQSPSLPKGEKLAKNITRKDIQTLLPGAWLNDEVINRYVELLLERTNREAGSGAPSCHIMNTFFYTQLLKRGSYTYQGVARWTRRANIFKKDILAIPLHLGVHWVTVVVWIKERRIEYYDSLGGTGESHIEVIRRYLSDEHRDKEHSELDLSEWTDYSPGQTSPQQENGFDCGVFTCQTINAVTAGEELTFQQSHIPYLRQRMAIELVKDLVL